MQRIQYIRIVLPAGLLAITLLLLAGCQSSRRSVAGSYTSNYGQTLHLKPDSSFVIGEEMPDTVTTVLKFSRKIEGRWYLQGRSVVLKVNDKKDAFWECYSLGVKKGRLKRPAHCGPTHRFLVFKKSGPFPSSGS